MRTSSSPSRRIRLAAVLVVGIPLAAACTATGGTSADTTSADASPDVVSTSDATTAPSAAPAPSSVPEPAPSFTPGQPCEPGSDPNCTDDTGVPGDAYRYVEGYADCLVHLETGYGELCADLDGDGVAGYPDEQEG